jgi:hypothetical protein
MFWNPLFDGASPELCAGERRSLIAGEFARVFREAVGLYKIVFTQRVGPEHGANYAKSH